jgi:teichuronic acid exporter
VAAEPLPATEAAQGWRAAGPPADIAPQEVGRALKRGAFWAFATQLAVQAVRFASVIVLARLLMPDDYGAAALAVTIASFSMAIGDLGYGMALVQAHSASQRWASTACWCALAAGAIGSGIAALGAYPAAQALREPLVAGLVMVGGLTLVLVAAGSTSNALLTRSMSFGVIQGVGLIASLAAAACAVALAAMGAGPWALVVQQVVLAAVTTVLFIVAARWKPSFEFSRTAMRSLSRFALPYAGGSAFFVLQGVVAVLFIGHLVGLEALGTWNLSMAIVIVPLTLVSAPLARVMYAAFARMQHEQERIADVWLRGFTLLAAILLPALFGLIAVAPDLIPFVFGAHWAGAVPVVQIMCALVMSRTLQTWNEAVMDAAGKPHVAMILIGAVLVTLPLGIWAGSAYGIAGVAVGYCVVALVVGELPSFVITTRQLSLKVRTVLGRLRGIVPACVAECVAVVLLRQALEDSGFATEPRLLASILFGAALYILLLTLFARGVVRELLDMARNLRATALSARR